MGEYFNTFARPMLNEKKIVSNYKDLDADPSRGFILGGTYVMVSSLMAFSLRPIVLPVQQP
jgi:hypothetical protein